MTERTRQCQKKKNNFAEKVKEESCKLSMEELAQVNGGSATFQFKGEDIAKLNTTEATSALQTKVAEVEINAAGQPGAGIDFRIR